MSKEERILQEIEHLELQIAELQNYLYEVELYPRQTELWPRIKRAVSLFLLRRQVTRQVQYLHLRRRMYRNCYVHVFKKEPRNGPPEHDREPAGVR
jgi:hypothetical protein